MSENANCSESLETTIKIEPEEFQESDPACFATLDDILRFKANIFSDPFVLLKDCITNGFDSSTSIGDHCALVKALARRGNKGRVARKDPHSCCLCRKTFSNRGNLSAHLEAIHCRTIKMSCDLCPKIFSSKPLIRQHMEKHRDRKFTCNICDYKTPSKHDFLKHKMTHAAKVECPICKKKVAILKSHLLTHKPKESCPVCQNMITKSNLLSHMKAHNRTHKCETCREAFESRQDLRRHNLRKHHTGQLYECDCGKIYSSPSGLLAHKKLQFSDSHPLRSPCKKMQHGRPETSRTPLSRNGPFICDYCGSRYACRKNFLPHISKHHLNSVKFCDLCPQSFHLKRLLVHHMNKVHLKLRPFECKICSHRSLSKSDLKIHMRVHEPKAECKICHKPVTNVKRHLSERHVEVECKICYKVFKKSSLNNHIKNIHNKK